MLQQDTTSTIMVEQLINANTFNVVTKYDFYNYNKATINADNFSVTAGAEFYNYATIEADSLTISADSLVNSHSYWGDGNIIANTANSILNRDTTLIILAII